MKAAVVIIVALIYTSSNVVCSEDSAADSGVTKDSDDVAKPEEYDFQKAFPGGPIDREEFLSNVKDLLGPTWTMFDLPNLEFYILPFLNYSTSMLQPHFTQEQVKHHWNGNVDSHRKSLNDALKEWREKDANNEVGKMSLLGMMENLDHIPAKYRSRIADHGGAYINHAIFFGLLSPNFDDDQRFPVGDVRRDIDREFQSFYKFKAKFNIVASRMKGAGWVFLVRKQDGFLQIETTSEHDSPIMNGEYPLLALDMWEHAWYLKHKHKRENYADDWWMLVDWTRVEALDSYWKEYGKKKRNPVNDNKTDRDEL